MRNHWIYRASWRIASLAIALAAAVLPWLCWNDGVIQVEFRTAIAGDSDPGGWMRRIERVYQMIRSDGAVAVRFIGFDENDPETATLIGETIARASYTLAPRRFWFADDGAVVMNGNVVLGLHFNPTLQWLHAHDVHWLYTYKNVAGKVNIDVDRVPGFGEMAAESTATASYPAVWCAAYVLVMLLCGFALTATLLPRNEQRSIAEVAGLVLTLGPGGAGMMLLGLSLIGMAPGRVSIACLGAVAVILLALLARMGRMPVPALPRLRTMPGQWDLLAIAPALLLVAAVAISTFMAVRVPIMGWDAFAMWGIKARFLAALPLTPRPAYFTNVSLGFTHLDYPLLLPMMLAGGYAMMHQTNEQLAKIVLPLVFMGQILLAYNGGRLWLSRLPAMMLAVLLAGAPAVLGYSSIAYADPMLMAFRMGSILYLVRWTLHRRRTDLILCALFTVFVVHTKNEGLPLAAFNALLVILLAATSKAPRRKSWIDAGAFCAIVGVGGGAWLAWRAGLPHIDENYLGRLSWSVFADNASRLSVILGSFAQTAAEISSWGGLWLLLPLLAAVGYRAFSRRETLLLWILLIGHLGLYVMVYVITNWGVESLIEVSILRLFLHIAPTAALILAVHWGSVVTVTSREAELRLMQANPAS